jgi:broad specificity phosphatase PhoE
MFYFIRHAETEFNVVRANIKLKYASSDYHIEPEWLT